jgi:hypothetical protein
LKIVLPINVGNPADALKVSDQAVALRVPIWRDALDAGTSGLSTMQVLTGMLPIARIAKSPRSAPTNFGAKRLNSLIRKRAARP